MCALCSDETVYRAYMAYLDDMERQGKDADPDTALAAAIAVVEAERGKAQSDKNRDDPFNPFICDPVDE